MAKAVPSQVKDMSNQFQAEVETEMQWRTLLRREGLVLIDVYASWTGPCSSMVSILKRIKVEVNDERLYYGMACSDNIDDLLRFKDQSEPCWLFVAGGKPIRVIRGSHVPSLTAAIKEEFAHELQCLAGKARRNFITIDDEVSRKKKVEAEATRLAQFVVEEDRQAADRLIEIRRESSVSLMGAFEPYTVAVIQPYLVESGNHKEIRDFLAGDFRIEQDITVKMTEDMARHLYKVPYEVPDPAAQNDMFFEEDNTFGDDAGDDDDNDDGPRTSKPKVPVKPKKKMLQIPLPDGLVGDCVILLLEHEEIRELASQGQKPIGTMLETADDYLRLKVGPITQKDAVEQAPNSLRAIYGKEAVPGVWCPRKYDDKRFVILNYFPNFMDKILSFGPIVGQKYCVAVLPLTVMEAFTDNIDVSANRNDVYVEKKMKLTPDIADEMLKSWDIKGSEIMMRKANLITNMVYVISFNPKNKTLLPIIKSLNPSHMSKNEAIGRRETSKLFKHLKLPPEEEKTAEEMVMKFLARSKPRFETDADAEEELRMSIDEGGSGSRSGSAEVPQSENGDQKQAEPTTAAPPHEDDDDD